MHELGYLDERDAGSRKVLQKILNGPSGLLERMTDSDRVPVSSSASAELVKAKEDGRFAPDSVEEDVSPLGSQVQSLGGLECLGLIRCFTVYEKKAFVFDGLQGLIDLPLALGKSRAHVVVHTDSEWHLGYILFDDFADPGGDIPLVEGSRPWIEAGVIRLHGLVQHHFMSEITDLNGQIP